MFGQKKKKKQQEEGGGGEKGAAHEEHHGQGLVSLPPSMNFSLLSSVSLDGNALDQSHLVLLLEQAPMVAHVSLAQNAVAWCPHQVASHKRLRHLNLDGNPVGWPRPPTKPHDWKRAVLEDQPGRRVFRLYLDERDGQIPFVDMEIVVMGDPMFPDKDEDRSDVKIGIEGWKHDGILTLKMHDRAIKTRFGDPDVTVRPWYRNELKHRRHVVPFQYVSVSVMDGHGGHWVSEALKQNLFKKLKEAGLVEADLPDDYEAILKKLYADLDAALLEHLANGAGRKRDGSTCVNAIFTEKQTLISHVGDSRCVLGFADGAIEQVTKDHEPDDPKEKAMVEAKGGKIEFHSVVGGRSGGGCWRVNADLAMTRSFGDPAVKAVISVEPDVAVRPALHELDAFVVASDGLWHHISSEDAIKIVRRAKNCEVACNKLYEQLKHHISGHKNKTFGADNTMICVAKLTRGSQPVSCPKLTLSRKNE